MRRSILDISQTTSKWNASSQSLRWKKMAFLDIRYPKLSGACSYVYATDVKIFSMDFLRSSRQ